MVTISRDHYEMMHLCCCGNQGIHITYQTRPTWRPHDAPNVGIVFHDTIIKR